MKRIISAVVVLIGLAAPAWAGFEEGRAAYERGDYATTLREFRALANQGGGAMPKDTWADARTVAEYALFLNRMHGRAGAKPWRGRLMASISFD